MNEKNRAILLMAKTKATKDKQKCKPYTKEEPVRVALPDAGRDDWARFKRECVLLKGGKSK